MAKARLWTLYLAGESHQNSDGSSRQEEIEMCSLGEPVELLREPNNRYDSKAVLVLSARGVGLGYVSRDDRHIADAMDEGIPVRGIIADMQGGAPEKPSLGCIRVRVGGKDPDRPIPLPGDSRRAPPTKTGRRPSPNLRPLATLAAVILIAIILFRCGTGAG